MLYSALRSVRTENDGVEFTFAAAYRPFVVRLGTVVINGIALVKDFDIIADLNFQLTAYNDIHLLTLVGMRMRNSVLFVDIGDRNEKRLADLVFEVGGKAHIGQTFSSYDRKPLACSRDIEAVDVRRFALHKVGDLDAALVSELVDKCEAEILCAALVRHVFIGGDAAFFSHFFGRQTYRFARKLNSFGYLSYFKLRVHGIIHGKPTPF